jgi:23S rRNA pseudouridine1911/1915/1917 synthase
LVHRLDRETSGVTVFGKHPKATARLAAAFREGRAKKEYRAVTSPGLPEAGLIDLPLSKDPSRPGRFRASARANGVSAVTRYLRLYDSAEVSVVALYPETGRTHQLRAHLAALGHPILGDTLYGGREGGRCLLHAHRLEIDGWTVEAPVPDDVARWFSSALKA